MIPEAAVKLEKFFRAFKGAAPPLLLLDYDGTLADFRIDRFRARPWAGVRKLLEQIQSQGRTRMAVITGRPPEEIEPLLGLEPRLEVWGLHGAARVYADGRYELEKTSAAAEQKLEELRTLLGRDALGGLFEDKPNAAVIHWRGHSSGKAKRIEQRTRALFEPLAQMDGLSLLEFESGLELRAGRDKGGAVREILQEVGPCSPATYLGDDITDEAGFRAINEARGVHLSVLVRRKRRETNADIWLQPPHELREFLRSWLRAASEVSGVADRRAAG
ncbi:MAG: trehalose-phosphatase [Terracidiphilus sp.]